MFKLIELRWALRIMDEYEPPELTTYGQVEELTKAGVGEGNDALSLTVS